MSALAFLSWIIVGFLSLLILVLAGLGLWLLIRMFNDLRKP